MAVLTPFATVEAVDETTFREVLTTGESHVAEAA